MAPLCGGKRHAATVIVKTPSQSGKSGNCGFKAKREEEARLREVGVKGFMPYIIKVQCSMKWIYCKNRKKLNSRGFVSIPKMLLKSPNLVAFKWFYVILLHCYTITIKTCHILYASHLSNGV